LNIFDDYDAKVRVWQDMAGTLKKEVQQKDIRIEQLMKELTSAKIRIGELEKRE
jgi:hypothetical protein